MRTNLKSITEIQMTPLEKCERLNDIRDPYIDAELHITAAGRRVIILLQRPVFVIYFFDCFQMGST